MISIYSSANSDEEGMSSKYKDMIKVDKFVSKPILQEFVK